MSGMFGWSNFNQDLSTWDVSNVTECQSFLQNNVVWTLPKPNFTNCSPGFSDTDGDGVIDSIDQDNSTREGVPVDENGVMLNPIYLDNNGVTIKSQEWGIVGDVGVIDGVEYTIVNDIGKMLNNGENISNICTSKVTSMYGLFRESSFNDDISHWDTSNVTNMSFLFNFSKFNGDISHWDTSKVTNMSFMFQGTSFNGDISNWDISSVTDISYMFSNPGDLFMVDISNWDTSKVTYMNGVFSSNYSFNGDISNWDTSSVIEMDHMFSGSNFNGDISYWNVSKVKNMTSMFDNSSFNGDLSNWDVSNVILCKYFSRYTPQWTLPKPNFTNCNPD